MSIEIAVVDDIAADRYHLIADIRSWLCRNGRADDIIVHGFSDGVSFLHSGGLSGRMAIVFLDICMDILNGIETAERLRGGLSDSLIIFVTTAQEYALAAYPVHPFDYFVKPYDLKRLDQVLSDAFRLLDAKVEMAEFRVPHGTIHLRIDQVESAVAAGHSVTLRLKDGTCVASNAPFSEVVERLAAYSCFLLINRGVLINMDFVYQLLSDSVVLQSGSVYPLRVRGRSDLIRVLTHYQIQRRMGC